MTIFGNRDSSYGSSTDGRRRPRPAGPAPPTTSARGFGAIDTAASSCACTATRASSSASAEGRENAVRIAREMVQHIEQAATNGEWPQIDERFIRPGAIVSIDVQRSE